MANPGLTKGSVTFFKKAPQAACTEILTRIDTSQGTRSKETKRGTSIRGR